MTADTNTKAYVLPYLESHSHAENPEYRRQYWNHFFLDALAKADDGGHFLEEGGGTCGIWNSLHFSNYTSVDVSDEMISAAQKLHAGKAGRAFIKGDIFSPALHDETYSALVANAYGVYYRPDRRHLARFSQLLKTGGIAFIAIDPAEGLKYTLAKPFAGLIDRRVRRYNRIAVQEFRRMARDCGFRVWLEVDYMPAPGWKRRAFFLIKD